MQIKVEDLTDELYLDEFKCDEYLAQDFEIVNTDPITFHFFWNGESIPFNEKHAACLNTFVKTQPLHYTAKVWVDKIPDYVNERVCFEIYDGLELAKGTPLEDMYRLLVRDPADNNCWVTSDIARLLILYKHGGIYYDFDMLFQRDLSPLMHIEEFVYCWPRHKHLLCNAVIKVKPGSEFIHACLTRVLELVLDGSARHASDFAGRPLFSAQFKANPYKLVVLPTGFFHADFWNGCVWPKDLDDDPWREPTSTFFVANAKSKNIFKHAFSWHWHNKWKEPVESDSKFDLILRSVLQQQ